MVQPKFDREVNKGSELKLSTPCLPMQSLEQAATRDGRAKLDLGANRPQWSFFKNKCYDSVPVMEV